jgi:cytochrome P450
MQNPAPHDPYGLMSPEARIDPYSVYARIREAEPVYFSEGWNGWLVTRHADVLAGLRDTRLSSKRAASVGPSVTPELRQQLMPLVRNMSSFMVLMDPPGHTRLRALVSKAFTPRLIEGLRPRIQALVGELLDGVDGAGEIDIMSGLAVPLPVIVINEMLGLASGDWKLLKDWSDAIAAFAGASGITPEVVGQAVHGVVEFETFIAAAIAERRRAPGADLLSTLIEARDAGDRLSEQELISTCMVLLIAGHETTTHLIGNGLHLLLRHPEQRAVLQAVPAGASLAGAVEEILRYETPIQRISRIALEDLEIAGRTIREGERVHLLPAAAHRDPAVFPDPDRFDVRRQGDRHLAFGFGLHFCLGAALARVEAEEALGALLRRWPAMELAEDPAWLDNIAVRGLRSLRVLPGLPSR